MQKKCLRIEASLEASCDDSLFESIQKQARSLHLEGTVQRLSSERKIKVVVCGEKKNVEQFVDFLHKELIVAFQAHISIEPFVKERDYRGVFRIIE